MDKFEFGHNKVNKSDELEIKTINNTISNNNKVIKHI